MNGDINNLVLSMIIVEDVLFINHNQCWYGEVGGIQCMHTLHLIPRFVLCHIILDIVRPVQAIRSTWRTLEGIPRHFILYIL